MNVGERTRSWLPGEEDPARRRRLLIIAALTILFLPVSLIPWLRIDGIVAPSPISTFWHDVAVLLGTLLAVFTVETTSLETTLVWALALDLVSSLLMPLLPEALGSIVALGPATAYACCVTAVLIVLVRAREKDPLTVVGVWLAVFELASMTNWLFYDRTALELMARVPRWAAIAFGVVRLSILATVIAMLWRRSRATVLPTTAQMRATAEEIRAVWWNRRAQFILVCAIGACWSARLRGDATTFASSLASGAPTRFMIVWYLQPIVRPIVLLAVVFVARRTVVAAWRASARCFFAAALLTAALFVLSDLPVGFGLVDSLADAVECAGLAVVPMLIVLERMPLRRPIGPMFLGSAVANLIGQQLAERLSLDTSASSGGWWPSMVLTAMATTATIAALVVGARREHRPIASEA